MPRFQYQALNAEHQPVTGFVEATTVGEAIGQLEADGLSMRSIAIADAAAAPADILQRSTPAAVIAEEHLARSLLAARPLAPALRAYAEEMPAGRRRRELLAVCSLLETADVAGAVQRWKSMPEYWIPLLSAAAAANDPGHVLREFLDEAERAQSLRAQWRRMLAYPVTVLALAFVVVLFLSIAVVPIFRDMFADFGLQLPRVTTGVLDLASFLTSGRGMVAGAAVLIIAVLLVLRRWILPLRTRNRFSDWYNLRFRRSAVISRFARFAAELLQAGIEPSAAVRLAAETTRLRQPSSTVVYAVSRDVPIASQARLLKEISNSFADRSRRRASAMQGLFGPIAVCFVGGCVLVVVLALFLPLVTLINSLSG